MSDNQPLVELIYYSRSLTSLTKDDFEFLLEGAREKNSAWDITGAIYYCNGHFLQLIEGPRQNINHLFQSISHDARHYDVSLVSFRTIEKRRFSDLAMAYFDKDISDVLAQKDGIDLIDLDTCLQLFLLKS